jgi:hypothetical protein
LDDGERETSWRPSTLFIPKGSQHRAYGHTGWMLANEETVKGFEEMQRSVKGGERSRLSTSCRSLSLGGVDKTEAISRGSVDLDDQNSELLQSSAVLCSPARLARPLWRAALTSSRHDLRYGETIAGDNPKCLSSTMLDSSRARSGNVNWSDRIRTQHATGGAPSRPLGRVIER